MLKRWNLIFGVFFVLAGIASLFVQNWLDAGWCLVLGIGSLALAYIENRPQLGRGPVAWTIMIIWAVILGALTIIRLTTP